MLRAVPLLLVLGLAAPSGVANAESIVLRGRGDDVWIQRDDRSEDARAENVKARDGAATSEAADASEKPTAGLTRIEQPVRADDRQVRYVRYVVVRPGTPYPYYWGAPYVYYGPRVYPSYYYAPYYGPYYGPRYGPRVRSYAPGYRAPAHRGPGYSGSRYRGQGVSYRGYGGHGGYGASPRGHYGPSRRVVPGGGAPPGARSMSDGHILQGGAYRRVR